MSDSPFELSVDSDWKQQARAEKEKLAAEAAQRREAANPPSSTPASPAAKSGPSTSARRLGPTDFKSLVRSVGDQALMYLGAIPVSDDGRGIVDLDAARRQIDLLTILETKTTGNLEPEETASLDLALYEARTRFASVASRYIL